MIVVGSKSEWSVAAVIGLSKLSDRLVSLPAMAPAE
jgi:hypothetical protein